MRQLSPLRSIPLGWAIGVPVIGSLAGTVLFSSSFNSVIPLRSWSAEISTTAIEAPSVVGSDSARLNDSTVSPTASEETIGRAQQQLASIVGSSELPSAELLPDPELRTWMIAPAIGMDVDALAWLDGVSSNNDADPRLTDASSTLADRVASSLDGGSVGGGYGGGGGATLSGGGSTSDAQARLEDGTALRGDTRDYGLARELGRVEAITGTEGRIVNQSDEGRRGGTDEASLARAGRGPTVLPGVSGGTSYQGNPVSSVPEPSVLLLMGIGLTGLAMSQRRSR